LKSKVAAKANLDRQGHCIVTVVWEGDDKVGEGQRGRWQGLPLGEAT